MQQNLGCGSNRMKIDRAAEESIQVFLYLRIVFLQNLPFWLERYPGTFLMEMRCLQPFRQNGLLQRYPKTFRLSSLAYRIPHEMPFPSSLITLAK